jgi:hypothetical protein
VHCRDPGTTSKRVAGGKIDETAMSLPDCVWDKLWEEMSMVVLAAGEVVSRYRIRSRTLEPGLDPRGDRGPYPAKDTGGC